MATARTSIIWQDAAGFTTQTLIRSTGSITTLFNALLAKSNADYSDVWAGTETIHVPSPVAAVYESVGDYALLEYSTAAGLVVTLKLPAPKSSIFLADGQTVDAGQITAITNAAILTVSDASGNLVTSFLGGTRRRRTRDYP